MSTLAIMGCDPGVKGGIAVVNINGIPLMAEPIPESDKELLALLKIWVPSVRIGYLELVHSMPHDGPVQAHRFGIEVGRLRMALQSCDLLFDVVDPRVWQNSLKCLTRGKKAVSRRKAFELFGNYDIEITDKTADALLIAEWGRRQIEDAKRQSECRTANRKSRER